MAERHDAATKEAVIRQICRRGSVRQSAKAVGVPESTVRKWLSDPEFGAALAATRRENYGRAVNMLAWSAVGAVRVLVREMNAEKPLAARVNAACRVLQFAFEAYERMDVETRLAALESQLAGIEGPRVVSGVEPVNPTRPNDISTETPRDG